MRRNQAESTLSRIATGEANLILGCDMLTAGAQDAISKTRPGVTVAVINSHEQPPGPFARNPDWQFPSEQIRALIDESVDGRSHYVDATRLATALLGDSIASNLFMLGYAFQKGLIPLSEAALDRAIELNAVAVEANKQAFLWGRRAAVDVERVKRIAVPEQPVVVQLPHSLDTLVRKRIEFLTAYQNAAYAKRYETFVERVREAEARLGKGDALTKAVARSLFKLMAYKDEYEVARLYTSGEFEERLKATFEGAFTVKFNLAPPLLAKRDAQGRLVKAQYGSWMWQAFKLLARFKFLRGTAFDPFGKTEERRMERQLIDDYRRSIESDAGEPLREEPCRCHRARQPSRADPGLRPRQAGEYREGEGAVASPGARADRPDRVACSAAESGVSVPGHRWGRGQAHADDREWVHQDAQRSQRCEGLDRLDVVYEAIPLLRCALIWSRPGGRPSSECRRDDATAVSIGETHHERAKTAPHLDGFQRQSLHEQQGRAGAAHPGGIPRTEEPLRALPCR